MKIFERKILLKFSIELKKERWVFLKYSTLCIAKIDTLHNFIIFFIHFESSLKAMSGRQSEPVCHLIFNNDYFSYILILMIANLHI
jgi:hypothetical protein